MKPVHRDDLEAFPGMQIVCDGDVPEGQLPPELVKHMKDLQKYTEKCLREGKCTDCGMEMPDFHTEKKNWKPAEGWRYFTANGEITSWQCPVCDLLESNTDAPA